MTHPVRSTFIDFRAPPPAPRRASCPPEFLVDAVIARAIKRERVKAKKRAGKLAKIAKKWEFVVEAAWKLEEKKVVGEIQALAPRIESSAPKLRCSMNSAVYPQFVRRVFPDLAHALFLETMGVMRKVGDSVQVCAADKVCDENEAMRDIVAEAKRMEAVFQNGCIQISLAGHTPLVFPWRKSLTLEGLRRTCERHFAIPPCEQRLSHLGTALRRGRLEDQGVGHGSVIELE